MSSGVGTYIIPSIVCAESLISLENNMVMGNLVYRNYDQEFEAYVGNTVAVRVPATHTSGTVAEGTINLSTVTQSSVTIVLEHHLDLTVETSSLQQSLDIVNFKEEVIDPLMRAHAQLVDEKCLAEADNIAGHYPVSATPAISDIAGLAAVLNVNKAPFPQRSGVMHPITQADYISLNAFINAEKSGDTKTLKEASMGRRLGIDWYMDQNVPTHTQPIADAAGTVISGASIGSGTMVFAAITASSTILANDVFKITGQDSWHRITTNSTGGTGGLNTAVFEPTMTAAASAGDVVTIQKTHRQNLAFHKHAFCLATAKLADPIGGVDSARMAMNGLSVRVVRGYTQTSKRNMLSVDLLIGTKTLDKALAARLCDAR